MNSKNAKTVLNAVGATFGRPHIVGKTQKGITLIALVITIIVLLILAGVTINMVLGDDGIIEQAEGAKDAYEKESANEDRQIKSASFEMDMITLEKNDPQAKSEIKTKYGMLTGINLGTTVSEVKKTLPKGYEILKEDGSAIDDEDTDANEEETTLAGTGMQVAKNGKMVLRLVIYGDIDGNGIIDGLDSTAFLNFRDDKNNSRAYYKKEAANLKYDKMLDGKDLSKIQSLIVNHSSSDYEEVVGKNRVPNNPDEIVIKTPNMAIEEYIENANKALQTAGNTTFRFEPKVIGDIYGLKGITSETTLKTLLTVLPDNTVIHRVVDNEAKYITKNSDETTLAGKVLLNDILTISDYYDGPKSDFIIALVVSIEGN